MRFLAILAVFSILLTAKGAVEAAERNLQKGNISKAVNILKKEAKRGNLQAILKLGDIYRTGRGVKVSNEKALLWYKKASQKSAKANLFIARIYQDANGTAKNIINYYQKAAKLNSTKALFALANIYFQGKIVPKDIKKALSLYKEAAKRGDKYSIYNLGFIYENGIGVQKDYKKAFEYYLNAAQKGYLNAKYNTAICYYLGKGVKQDKKEAFRWFKEAAKDGDIESIYNVGVMYYKGEGVLRNKIYAFNYLWEAAKNSHQKAQDILDKMCKESSWACR